MSRNNDQRFKTHVKTNIVGMGPIKYKIPFDTQNST